MYQVKDKIIHFRDGLATIVDKKSMNNNEYYVIQAVRGSGEAIYVPVKTADLIVRNVMDVALADKVLTFMRASGLELTPNTKQRRDSFKRKLGSGSPYDVAFLSKQLYLYENQEDLNIIVKFGPADLEMLRYAKNVLFDELAITYSVDREAIEQFVLERIKNL